MSTRSNDRAFLCSFTFSDGRRCRTPRSVKHPHLCYFHARKEAQSLAAEDLGRDITYFFSGPTAQPLVRLTRERQFPDWRSSQLSPLAQFDPAKSCGNRSHHQL